MHSISALLVVLLMSTTMAAQNISSDHARKTLEIYTRIIETDTSKEMGNTPKVARYLADELIAAGFPEEDVEVVLRQTAPPGRSRVSNAKDNTLLGLSQSNFLRRAFLNWSMCWVSILETGISS